MIKTRKILITTGLSPTDVGGPAQYAPNLAKAFQSLGFEVKTRSFSASMSLVTGVRHILFFFKLISSALWADTILTLDTFSVGVPSVVIAKILRRKSIVRVGGDFLWEAYIGRTKEALTLTEFYEHMPNLNLKERIVLSLTKGLLRHVDIVAFNTEWQRSIWQKVYSVPDKKIAVIRNFVPKRAPAIEPERKNILWAGRMIPIKNVDILKEAYDEAKLSSPLLSLDIVTKVSHNELIQQIRRCYAVVQPSLTEISSNFILEAASFGKPFILTNQTGTRELYDKGGIFINPKDKKELREALIKIMEPLEYERLRRELLEIEVSRSWEVLAKEYQNLI